MIVPMMKAAALSQRPLWSPLLLGASLAAWWSALESSSITLAGANVPAWASIVGGISATQATGAVQPIYAAAGINSRPSLTFGSRWLDTPLNCSSVPRTVAALHVVNNIATYQTIIGGVASGGYQVQVRAADGFAAIVKGITVEVGHATIPCVAGAVSVDIAAYDGAAYGFAHNGSEAGSGSASVVFTSTTSEIGTRNVGAETYTGNIGMIVVLNAVLDTVTRQKLESYMAWQYGAASSLPAAHPYKNAPPRASLDEMERWADERGWRVIDLAANRERARRIYTPPRRLIVPDGGWRIAA
ncbi:hypothetical protein [Methylosinus sp. Ce-a6]|uniref:hypothetical protein n=1 Tax=Methylosinus sp. Ce-a6 TaxID=2172005 RepID=UPI00135A325E|nr:hypothetical protein [Methylosinus sp. Ce-a6]